MMFPIPLLLAALYRERTSGRTIPEPAFVPFHLEAISLLGRAEDSVARVRAAA